MFDTSWYAVASAEVPIGTLGRLAGNGPSITRMLITYVGSLVFHAAAAGAVWFGGHLGMPRFLAHALSLQVMYDQGSI